MALPRVIGRQCLRKIFDISRHTPSYSTIQMTRSCCNIRTKIPEGLHYPSPINRRWMSTQSQTEHEDTTGSSAEEQEVKEEVRKPKEHKITGSVEKKEFQAETAKLLDIVAKSLYSENEIFIREIISNSSDALEKLRYNLLSDDSIDSDVKNMEIHLYADKYANTLTIEDTGIGMTKEELLDNLGTIARSGSKAFLQAMQDQGQESSTIIGQFGVGFYSTFMVANKVTVYTKPHTPDSVGCMWTSSGGVEYEVAEADDISPGTKVVIELKPECRHFAVEDKVKEIIQKYSNFVSFPIYLNDKQLNTVQPLWMKESSNIEEDEHLNFFRYISGSTSDHYLYKLFYKTDSPLNIRSIFYVPENRPSVMDMSKDQSSGVSLYSRRVLIQHKTENLLPKWLRFTRGVVDSEDIPLNLSRELLQNSSLIAKLREALANKIIRYFVERSKKDAFKYNLFHTNYKMFITEGVLSEDMQDKRENIAQLLRYESSDQSEGEMTSFKDYIDRMKPDQRNIYYLCAPSRQLAESSPYFEALKSKNYEVLFCYDPYDEITLMQLKYFNKKQLFSVENEIVSDMYKDEQDKTKVDFTSENGLSESQAEELIKWAKLALENKVIDVKITDKLDKHPAMATVWEMGSVRHYLRSQYLTDPKGMSESERQKLFKPVLQLSSTHPIILSLAEMQDEETAKLVLEQLYDNAMVGAGLIEDARPMVGRLNELLTKILEKKN